MLRSAQKQRRTISASLIAAGAVLLNIAVVHLGHLAGHPLILDTVFTGVAAAACGAIVGTVTGGLTTLSLLLIGACPVCRHALVATNGLAGLILGFALPWNREVSPTKLLVVLAAVVLATTVTGAFSVGEPTAFESASGLRLIRTTYHVLRVDPPWPEFFYLLPLNLADKMLTVGMAILVGPLIGRYHARWVAAGTRRATPTTPPQHPPTPAGTPR